MKQKQILAQRPNDGKTLASVLEAINQKNASQQDCLLPATVVSYNRKENLAVVRPLIQVVMVNGESVKRNPLTRIHVLSMGGGGFHLNFPIKAGDIGWIFAADRDITKFRETLAESVPNTSRMHSFSDGLFIPEVFRNYIINAEDNDAMVIQSTDAKTRISIRGDNIKITAPSNVVVDTPQTTFTGNVTVTKQLIVSGSSTLSKTSVEGLDVKSHIHTNPEGGNVGPMKN